jgi:hypothetical protein
LVADNHFKKQGAKLRYFIRKMGGIANARPLNASK